MKTCIKPTGPSVGASKSYKINDLRQKIYERCGLTKYRPSYRPRKLRKVCELAKGLDLRRKADVIFLAKGLGIIASDPVASVATHV